MIDGPGLSGYRRCVISRSPFASFKVLCHENTAGAAVHMFAEAPGCSSQLSEGRSTGNDSAMTPRGSITEIATAKSMRLIARGVAAGRLHTTSSGAGHIPASGPALIIARHYHHMFDGLALFAAIPRQFHIVVTLDWVQNAGMRLLITQLTRLARWPVVLRADALMHRSDHSASQF